MRDALAESMVIAADCICASVSSTLPSSFRKHEEERLGGGRRSDADVKRVRFNDDLAAPRCLCRHRR